MHCTQLFSALAAALLIGGCATTGDSGTAAPAPRAAASSTQAAATPAPAPAPRSASQLGMGPGSQAGARSGASGRYPQGRSIYYEYDKAELKAEDRRLIEQHARYLREHPGTKLRIEGNADERGSAEYNLALGQRRAEGVLRALRAGGVGEDRLEAVSFGKEKPRAQGHDEKSWAENRRSDIVYR
jgi:peptidoglycan-associated lipoprotein